MDTENQEYVEPAHDALVRGWRKLMEWVKEEKNLRLQRRLTPAAVEWKSQQQAKQKARYLWNADPYLNVLKEVLNSQNNNWLNQLETEFVQQSIRQKHKDTRSRWGIGITVSLVITTFVASAATNFTNKPNVIFASPEQEIQGTTDYRYLYTPDTAKKYAAVYNQILMGFSTKSKENTVMSEGVPGCLDVGQLSAQGEKIKDGEHFTIKAPKEPGVYYVKFRSAFEYSCDSDAASRSAKQKWQDGDYPIPEQSNIGIVVVGNVFNFPYPEIWQAYSNNVLNQNTSTGDENANSGVYVVLRNFKFDKNSGNASNKFASFEDKKLNVAQ